MPKNTRFRERRTHLGRDGKPASFLRQCLRVLHPRVKVWIFDILTQFVSLDLQFLFIGVYFGFSMGMAPPLSYAYGDRKIDVCRKLEQYAHRFFAIAPLVIYALTYFLAPVGVSCFANTASPVFPIAVSGMRIYGLGFLFSGINIYAAVRMMAYGKGYFSGLITFLRSFALLLLFLTVLPQKFGLTGVWLAVPAAEVLTLLVAVWFLRPIQR